MVCKASNAESSRPARKLSPIPNSRAVHGEAASPGFPGQARQARVRRPRGPTPAWRSGTFSFGDIVYGETTWLDSPSMAWMSFTPLYPTASAPHAALPATGLALLPRPGYSASGTTGGVFSPAGRSPLPLLSPLPSPLLLPDGPTRAASASRAPRRFSRKRLSPPARISPISPR
jgi:hypothetical protein